MLWVTVIRRPGDKVAHGHVVQDGMDRAFCGDAVPTFILDTWDDPRNPYKGKSHITCHGCLGEYNNGRRSGYRDQPTNNVQAMEDSTENAEVD